MEKGEEGGEAEEVGAVVSLEDGSYETSSSNPRTGSCLRMMTQIKSTIVS